MITLLMSVYAGERPEFLSAALNSLEQQTDQPDEILLVKDGPISQELESVIKEYERRLGLRTISLPDNGGLARALNAGLAAARHPWIMRFDTDDLCLPHRVARQRKMIESDTFDVFGSQIIEFDDDPVVTTRLRNVPTQHSQILQFSRKRNPFNHMTVCYRKDLVLRCGGYPEIRFLEDYALWIKMLVAGAQCANDAEPLVKARIGNGMINRRGGLRYARSEIKLQAFMVREGFKPFHLAVVDAATRLGVILAPITLRKLIYNRFLRRTAKV